MFICDINDHGMITYDIKYLYLMSLKRIFFKMLLVVKWIIFQIRTVKYYIKQKCEKNVFALIIYFYVIKKKHTMHINFSGNDL